MVKELRRFWTDLFTNESALGARLLHVPELHPSVTSFCILLVSTKSDNIISPKGLQKIRILFEDPRLLRTSHPIPFAILSYFYVENTFLL